MDTKAGIWCVRHGKTKLNSTNASTDYIRGWRDVPLDAEGKREAKEIVAFLAKDVHPVRIYSSDLQRAKDIATEAAKECKCPLEVSSDFRPWGLGKFTGRPAKDVVPQLQAFIDSPDKPVPGGGESFNTFRRRVLGAVKRVMAFQQSVDENVVIITHFRDLKLIEAWLSHGGNTDDIDAKVFAQNDVPTGGMLLLHRERGRWTWTKEQRRKVGIKRAG